MESKFADVGFARNKYRSVVRQIINCGVCGSDSYHAAKMNIIITILADNYLLLFWDSSSRIYESFGRYYP